MKKLLQPKYIIILVLLAASFFIVRNALKTPADILIAGDQSEKLCPVHNIKLKLDVVPIAIHKEEPDSFYIADQKKYFPLAQDTFYLLQWFQDDEHKNIERSQVWYCPSCREAKKKYNAGQTL